MFSSVLKTIVGSPTPAPVSGISERVELAEASFGPSGQRPPFGDRRPSLDQRRLTAIAEQCGLDTLQDLKLITDVRRAVDSYLTRNGGEFVVAVDGLAASGKSSNSARLALLLSTPEFNCQHLSSGSLYRAVTILALKKLRLDVLTAADVEKNSDLIAGIAQDLIFELKPDVKRAGGAKFLAKTRKFHFLNDITDDLASDKVEKSVSFVAKHPGVRAALNEAQKRFAISNRLAVIDGRDAGTTVFPDAPVKIFLTVSDKEATRRSLIRAGNPNPTEPQISVAMRDVLDRNRKDIAQTVIPRDAIVVDTSRMDSPQVLRTVLGSILESLKASTRAPVLDEALWRDN